jgi:hypothetical protein
LTNGIASNSSSPAATPTRPFTPISQFNEPTLTTLNQPNIENTPPPPPPQTTTATTTTTEMNINIEENVKITVDEENVASTEEISMVISTEKIETDQQVEVEASIEQNEVVNINVDNLNEQQTTE